MAETAVGLVVDKLVPLLIEEANLLRGVRGEVQDIQRELQSILAFLKDADSRAEAEGDSISDGVKLWVEDLRGAAFQIENVIDKYTHLMAQQQLCGRGRFVGFLRKVACLIVQLKPRRDIASKVQELKQTVRDINLRSAAYGFTSANQGSSSTAAQNGTWYDPRKDSCFLQNTEVVGIESTRDELVGVLEGGSPQRTVVAVVGMGGLGKTTVAHQVFNRAKGRFDCHAWIEVSQSYHHVDLLRNLMKKLYKSREESVPQGIDTMDERTVVESLRDYLKVKSYFICFDDVWNENFWGGIKNALPDDNEKARRIVITTRLVEVANFCKTSSFVHIHHLKPLPLEKAWELFCKKAFQYEFEGNCPPHLEGLSGEIVERCEGLPLAIVVIAGLLSTKNKTVDEWRKLLSNLSSELANNKHLASITKILSLSYYDLPHYLKSCFLYFGIFPEDYSIRCRRLVRMWIAEGFVKQQENKTLEVVAEEYLMELINRNVVQVSEMDLYGKPRSCSMHDLLHEMVLKKIENLNFCQVLSSDFLNFRGLTRRISIVHNSYGAFANCNKISHVRSIFVFDKDEMLNSLGSTIATNFKLLKVLDFEDAPSLDQLPSDIGNLFHLRYLSVRGTRVNSLPKSIKKLENLETLDLKKSLVYELPMEINRLCKLRHLLAYCQDDMMDFSLNARKGVKIPKGFGCLKALEKLHLIEANIEGVDVFEELRKLTELRKLVISKVRSDDGRALRGCVEELKHLEALEVYSVTEDEPIDLESMSSPPQFLKRLSLHGRLRKFPEWITNLQNVIKITITWSKLQDDLLKALQKLPNLLDLKICNDAHYGEKLRFEEGGFPKLKVLWLYRLSRLNTLVIEEGALPYLEELWIQECPHFKEELSGFQHLKNLKILRFVEMPTCFLLFQNFDSIHFVPHVLFYWKYEGEYTLLRFKDVFEIQKYVGEHEEVDWNSLSFEEIVREVYLQP